jgi:hypothetical protein
MGLLYHRPIRYIVMHSFKICFDAFIFYVCWLVFKTSTQLHTFTFPTLAHLQFNTSISSSPRKHKHKNPQVLRIENTTILPTDIKNKSIQTNLKGVQNYVTNGPHLTNLFKIYLTLYFNCRLPVQYCILVTDYTCNNYNFGQFYFLIFYVGKHQNSLMVLVTETCSQ